MGAENVQVKEKRLILTKNRMLASSVTTLQGTGLWGKTFSKPQGYGGRHSPRHRAMGEDMPQGKCCACGGGCGRAVVSRYPIALVNLLLYRSPLILASPPPSSIAPLFFFNNRSPPAQCAWLAISRECTTDVLPPTRLLSPTQAERSNARHAQ